VEKMNEFINLADADRTNTDDKRNDSGMKQDEAQD